jgi:DNA-binding MarR family transcriptional regulator
MISGADSGTDLAVDELGDAVVTLVRTWRSIGRRTPEGSHSALAVLEMARLLGDDEHRLGEIAELRGVDQSVISRQIGELEARHLVCRRPDPKDRRASLVRLTPAGHDVLDRARTLRQDWLRGALARSPVTDVRTAARLVAALADELEARASELGPFAAPLPDPPPGSSDAAAAPRPGPAPI